MLIYSWFVVAFALGGLPVSNTDSFAMENSTPQDSVLASAEFVRIDRSHWARGDATLRRDGDEVVLYFGDDFEVSRGPDLRVLLSPHPDPRSAGDLGSFVELGKLVSNEGSSRYAVREAVDLGSMQSVVIFCHPYEVVFSTATLVEP